MYCELQNALVLPPKGCTLAGRAKKAGVALGTLVNVSGRRRAAGPRNAHVSVAAKHGDGPAKLAPGANLIPI